MFDLSNDAVSTSRSMQRLATYPEYRDARDAVDTLSDAGFDVSRVEIVWNGLRRVERVTGRRTVPRAALEGAGAGAWFGLFIGLLLAIFIDTDDAAEYIGVVLAYLVMGALVGAIWFGVMHWSTRGKRDFSSVPVLVADSYDVVAESPVHAEAARILGVTSSRPLDPPPANP